DGIRDRNVTGVQTCALPIWRRENASAPHRQGRRAALSPGDVAPARSAGTLHRRLIAISDRDVSGKGRVIVAPGRGRAGEGTGQQIGRASCRERVESSVVAVT